MKAVILSAGYGTRLGHLTHDIPKPMLPLRKKPLLEYTIRYLACQGFRDLAVNLHYLPDQITGYFGDGSQFGVHLTYSYEDSLLGTAGAVKNLQSWVGNCDDLLVMYGDIITNQDLSTIMEFHRDCAADITILLHERRGSNSLVSMDGSQRVTGFVERPTDEQRRASPYSWVYSGLHLMRSALLDALPAGRPLDFPRDVFVPCVHALDIRGYPLAGQRWAIDSPDRYEEVQTALATGQFVPRNESAGE